MIADALITVLLVEDDERLASLTKEYLERHNVVVTVACDGDRGLEEAMTYNYDVLLLDIMLPGKSGIEVCQSLRRHKDVPVIMITARGEEADRVLGLEIGADDYVPKPFSPRELLARIRSVVRRARGQMGPNKQVVTRGSLVLDPGGLSATLDGKALDLTTYEFSLLHALAESAGRVLSRDHLMDVAKGSCDEAFDRSIDVHISRLRKKLGDEPKKPKLIKTVRNAGYLFLHESDR